MEKQECQYEVLTPWAEVDPVPLHGISPRLTDLKGKNIGLYSSSKQASDGVITAVEEQLRERLPDTKFTWYKAGNYYHGQPFYREPQHQEWKKRFEEWLRGVDGVILAQGD